MAVVDNEVESYHGDQLVVELRDTGLVQQELQQLGIPAAEIGSSDLLRLKLLELSQVGSGAAVLRQDSTLVEAASLDRRSHGQLGDGIEDLDLVLFALRRSMRETYDGWAATVGKNRILGKVQDSPYVKGGVGHADPAGPLAIPAVQTQPYGKGAARVAILDTRLYRHPDLAGRYLGESVADFCPSRRASQAHATFIAGLIIQRAPAAELVIRPVLDDAGTTPSSWDVATDMVGILNTGIAVLNLSLGCVTMDRTAPFCLSRAVEQLTPTIVVVAAAGNLEYPAALAAVAAAELTLTTPHYPAAIDGVVAVGAGAYDPETGTVASASFSQRGPWVDLLAPGVRVRSTFLSGLVLTASLNAAGQLTEDVPEDFGEPGYAIWDGTSFAAANVTGEIAARMIGSRVSAHDALGQLLKPDSPGADIVPYTQV